MAAQTGLSVGPNREMSGHRPSRNWEGPKKAGAKSRGRTRRFFCVFFQARLRRANRYRFRAEECYLRPFGSGAAHKSTSPPRSLGEGGAEVIVLRFLVGGSTSARGRELAEFVRVERGLAADLAFDLLPGQLGELLGDAGALDESVAHVDVELEGDRELIVHEAGGD